MWTCLIKLCYFIGKRKFLVSMQWLFWQLSGVMVWYDMWSSACVCVCVSCRFWPEVSAILQELFRSTPTACWRSPPSSGSVEEEVFFCSSSSSSSSHTSVNPVTRTERSNDCSCRCTTWSPEWPWSAKRVKQRHYITAFTSALSDFHSLSCFVLIFFCLLLFLSVTLFLLMFSLFCAFCHALFSSFCTLLHFFLPLLSPFYFSFALLHFFLHF